MTKVEEDSRYLPKKKASNSPNRIKAGKLRDAIAAADIINGTGPRRVQVVTHGQDVDILPLSKPKTILKEEDLPLEPGVIIISETAKLPEDL